MRSFVPTALLLLLSLFLCGLLIEVGTRIVVGSPWPERLPLVRVAPDPILGWSMVPGDVHYTYHHRVRLNELGFRGPEVPPKLPNEYRILAIGDSHVYGQGLAESELVTAQLQSQLSNGRSSCIFRVVNMGIRAYSINQQLALLELTGLALEPDHVLLFFYINDFEPVSVASHFARFKDLDWYTFDLSGKPDGTKLRKWRLKQVLRRSAFLMWADNLVKAWRYRGNIEELILAGATSNEVDHRIASTLDYLHRFAALLQLEDIRFTLVAVPVAAQIARDFPSNKYQLVLDGFAKEAGVDYIDVLPALRQYSRLEGRLPLIPFDGHYDAAGHRVISAYLSEKLWDLPRSCDHSNGI